MPDFDWTLVPANMDYYRRSEVDVLIDRARKEFHILQNRLTEADILMTKHYPCYSEANCKKCAGGWDKIHYETCAGYNVLKVLRGG